LCNHETKDSLKDTLYLLSNYTTFCSKLQRIFQTQL